MPSSLGHYQAPGGGLQWWVTAQDSPVETILEQASMFQYQPVDTVAPAFIAEVLATPLQPTKSVPIKGASIMLLSSTTVDTGPAGGSAQACEIMKYVPFLGPFLAGSCVATGVVVTGVGIYSWLKKFTETKYAVYFRGTLLTVLTAGAAQVFMENAKRSVRDQVRLRKAG